MAHLNSLHGYGIGEVGNCIVIFITALDWQHRHMLAEPPSERLECLGC
jgi:hypothetical protein